MTSHAQPNMNTCITYTHLHTHADTHRDTIHQIKINCIVIHLFTSQVMDSQVDSETLNSLLENDIISLSGGESDKDLLGSDPDTNSWEDMCIKKYFSILDELLASPPIHNSTNTDMSTTSFTTNTTIPTHTLQHQPTAATLPTSTTPLSPNTSFNASPLPLHTNLPSTSTSTPKCTPLTYDPSICHSPFNSFQVTPTTSQNLNYPCISRNFAPTFNTMQNHLSSNS